MDTLHTVLRNIRSETKAPRSHMTVFREFLNHLERASRRRPPRARSKSAKSASRQGK
jgi:hypothetical protein